MSEKDVIMYTINDIQKIFQCGKNQAYSIIHANGFPKIKIGKRLLVEKRALEKWLVLNQGKTVFTA